MLGNIADPLLYMLALGYGIGALMGEVGGLPYIAFMGTGHGLPERDVHRELRGDVLGVLAHACAADLGGDHQRADRARRRGARRVDLVRRPRR